LPCEVPSVKKSGGRKTDRVERSQRPLVKEGNMQAAGGRRKELMTESTIEMATAGRGKEG